MLHFDHSHELICESRVGILSRVMGKVLLSHAGGGLFLGTEGLKSLFWFLK